MLNAAYERAANNLRRINKPNAAENLLREGLAKWPQGTSELRYQLAQHYEFGGHIRDAVAAYQELSKEESRVGTLSLQRLDALRTTKEGCMLHVNVPK